MRHHLMVYFPVIIICFTDFGMSVLNAISLAMSMTVGKCGAFMTREELFENGQGAGNI